MKRELRIRFWLEAALAGFSGLVFVLTMLWSDWIEIVFGVDPDHHSGSLEWLIVAVALLATVGFSVSARLEWRRHAVLEPRLASASTPGSVPRTRPCRGTGKCRTPLVTWVA